MPSWEPVAIAVALAIGLSLLGLLINRRRARTKAKREASKTFRSAFFAETIANLDNKDAYLLISHAQAKHDAAIIEFRPFVGPKRIEHFDAAEQKFHRCRSELQPRVLKVHKAIDLQKPVDNSDTVRLREALNELLAFADKT
jgi:hypothetical protein